MKVILDADESITLEAQHSAKVILRLEGVERHINVTHEGVIIDDVVDGEPVRTECHEHEELLELPDDDAEKYPECAKLSARDDERRTAIAFLEWLEAQGLRICELSESAYHRTMKSHDALTMAFLEVDTKKLEEERRAMLAAMEG